MIGLQNLVKFNSNLKKWTSFEWIFFFILIPLFLLLIYLIPQNLKDSFFVLNPQHLFYTSLLLNNYTHSVFWTHLLPNLMAYLVSIFLIFNFATNKKSFYCFFAILSVPISIILSYITILVLPTYVSQGFSGIVAGLIGYSVYASYKYLKEVKNINFHNYFIAVVFLINALAIWLILPPIVSPPVHDGVFAIIFVTILANIYLERNGFKQFFIALQTGADKVNSSNAFIFFIYWIILIAFSLIVYIGLIFLIPNNPNQNGSLTNTIVHYLGFASGLFLPLIYELVEGNSSLS